MGLLELHLLKKQLKKQLQDEQLKTQLEEKQRKEQEAGERQKKAQEEAERQTKTQEDEKQRKEQKDVERRRKDKEDVDKKRRSQEMQRSKRGRVGIVRALEEHATSDTGSWKSTRRHGGARQATETQRAPSQARPATRYAHSRGRREERSRPEPANGERDIERMWPNAIGKARSRAKDDEDELRNRVHRLECSMTHAEEEERRHGR